MSATESVLDLFLELAAIPSPPGRERAVADRVHGFLHGLGLEPDEDEAGAAIGSEIGNIYCHLPATAPGTPDLPERAPGHRAAHGCDRAGRATTAWSPTASDAILGADNKAAVAAMLAAVRDLVQRGGGARRAGAGVHADGGGRTAGRQAVRRLAAAGRVRLLLRPRRADRPDRAGGAVPAHAAAHLPRTAVALGHGPRARDAVRSWPRRVRSPRCRWGASTRRPPPTSA